MKLAKSPGPGGKKEDGEIILKWLQAVYRYSYQVGELPEHMKKSQIRLIYI